MSACVVSASAPAAYSTPSFSSWPAMAISLLGVECQDAGNLLRLHGPPDLATASPAWAATGSVKSVDSATAVSESEI